MKFSEQDSIFIEDFNIGADINLIGVLSDTTEFYGIVFLATSAVTNPGLIIFDKSGRKLAMELLTHENCLIYAGEILLCKEYTTINRDLSLDYHYKSLVVTEFIESQIDTTCTHEIRQGRVAKDGKIDLGKIEHVDCK